MKNPTDILAAVTVGLMKPIEVTEEHEYSYTVWVDTDYTGDMDETRGYSMRVSKNESEVV